jgi:hypothetical protein
MTALLAAGYLLAPDTTSKVVDRVVDGVVDVTSTVADGAGTLLSKYWPWILGIGAYFLIKDSN